VDGAERWVADGQRLLDGRVARTGALMAERSRDPQRWDDVPAAAYLPAERLKAMDAAGIQYSVLYPIVSGLAGEAFGRLDDPDLEQACVAAYNDWLIEEWAATSDRFIPQCLVPIWPPQATVQEIRRAVAKGHRGVVFPSVPMDLRQVPHISGPEYDVVWSTCEELEVPLCLHSGASPRGLQYQPRPGLAPAMADAVDAVTRPVSSVFVLGHISFSGLLLRHPRLRVVLAESALGWGVLYMEKADHEFRQDGLAREGYELKPSEMFGRQCYFTSWFDDIAPFIPHVGAEHVLWSSNLPLATSTWPMTQETIDRCFQGVSAEARDQVLWNNAASLYRIDIAWRAA
jgi:predicted TIM-barrel fold metal-dependent hydrolase